MGFTKNRALNGERFQTRGTCPIQDPLCASWLSPAGQIRSCSHKRYDDSRSLVYKSGSADKLVISEYPYLDLGKFFLLFQ